MIDIKTIEQVADMASRFRCCPFCGNEELESNHYCKKCDEGRKGFTEEDDAYWFSQKLWSIVNKYR